MSAQPESMSPLTVPEIPDGTDTLTAALAYAKAGWYVGPVRRRSKDPGSVLGRSWQTKTSRDPQVIVTWFAGTDYGVFLHCGRSGAVVLDDDRPEKVPREWRELLADAPFQRTRMDDIARGHHIFAMPPGRMIGNPNWAAGEVRGLNGVIIVAPSVHERDDGCYRWARSGKILTLPDVIADTLTDSGTGQDAVNDATLSRFLDECTGGTRVQLLNAPLDRFQRTASVGSRHAAATEAACWIAREAAAGMYPARQGFGALATVFAESFTAEERRHGRGGPSEIAGIVAWAVGQLDGRAVANAAQRVTQLVSTDSFTSWAEGLQVETPHAREEASTCAELGTHPWSSYFLGTRMIPHAFWRREHLLALRTYEAEIAREAKAAASVRVNDRTDFDDEYLDVRELDRLVTPPALIRGVLPRGAYALITGRDGTFKSFVAIDWALSLATGLPWQGRAVQRVKVLYVAAEGAYGIRQRVAAWERLSGVEVEQGWFTLRKSPVDLYAGGAALDDLEKRIREGGYGLVILDTLRRVSGGADGNSSDMGVVVDNIVDVIKAATADGSVVVIAHTTKDDRDSRGYSGIEDDGDVIWHAKRPDDESHDLTITCSKYKDGPDGHSVELHATQVDLGEGPDGERASSLAITAPLPRTVVEAAQPSVEDAVLAAFRHLFQVGTPGKSTHGLTQSEVVKVISARSAGLVREVAGSGFPETTAKRAFRKLVADNVLVSVNATQRFIIPSEGVSEEASGGVRIAPNCHKATS